MVDPKILKQYKVTIGIECHVQLKTKSKLFSGAGNDARSAEPNTLVNHIDFGLPGALPVLNAEAVRLASRAAFALNTVPQKFSKFDRKHYFYPDLPMGYQITQYDEPIILGGYVDIEFGGKPKRIGITRAHIESDAGKSTHPAGRDYSLVDLNRAGTPLLEIVSEPDMHSAEEAKTYCKTLWLLMKYADVSEVSLFYGNMRFDVNVSVSKTDELGTRTETKNLNSFRSVEKAVDYELSRQIELLEKGEKIVQETRGWLDDKQKTVTQRSKENADDYRYMPDPDLPPIILDDAYIEQIEAEMPAGPSSYLKLLSDIGIDKNTASDIIASPSTAQTIARINEAAGPEHARRVAFWLLQPQTDELELERTDVATDESLIKLSQMVGDNKLSSTAAKEVLSELLSFGGDPEKIAEAKNLLQVSDEGAIAKIVEQVLAENFKAATDVKNGEMKAIGFLVGQVMKLSRGKANPAMAQKLIKQQLKLN
jgi:aspartyl-tRNA(Asn)/glutamyl-tRNA(Gln) amidotransferase subunit B